MSLILEALKKSEAERRLGQAPGLTTPMPTVRRRQGSGGIAAAAAGTALLLLGALIWWVAGDATDSSVEAPSPTSQPVPVRSPTPGNDVTDPSDATRASSSPVVETSPEMIPPPAAPTPAPTAPTEIAVDAAPTPRTPDFESIERESVPQAAQSTPSQIRATSIAPPVVPEVVRLLPAPAPDAGDEEPVPALEQLPRLDQLSTDVRDALPPLKVSMHVYAESPLNRFVLIDGHRYGEGEKLAASLQVIQIRRDGTVLDFNGQRFLLQRP